MYKLLLSLFSLTLASSTLAGEAFRDPSQPPNYQTVSSVAESASTAAVNQKTKVMLNLQGIYKINGQLKALINGKGYKKGDQIYEYQVVGISNREVQLLALNGKKETLLFNRLIDIDNTPNTTLQNTQSSTEHDLFAFVDSLKSCKHSSLELPFPRLHKGDSYKQQILGLKNADVCLVIHRFGSNSAVCRYSRDVIEKVAQRDKVKQLAQQIDFMKNMQTSGRNIIQISLDTPDFCSRI